MLNLLAENVEADGLGEGSALANSHDITGLDTEGWGAVNGDVLVTLLEPVVLLDVMKVIAADDNSAAHFGRDHDTPVKQDGITVSTTIV